MAKGQRETTWVVRGENQRGKSPRHSMKAVVRRTGGVGGKLLGTGLPSQQAGGKARRQHRRLPQQS